MKRLVVSLILSASVIFAGCSVFPLDAQIKTNHFRFENFKRDKDTQLEYLYLMCFSKKPISWAEPKQYLAGEHNFWVRAHISQRNIASSARVAYANFKVNLQADKSYMLNRKLENDKISMWIQEVKSGQQVSEVITKPLVYPLLDQTHNFRKQCRTSSI